MVNLRVLKNGNLRVGTILSFIMGFGLYGSTFIIPFTRRQAWMDGHAIRLTDGAGSVDHRIYDADHRATLAGGRAAKILAAIGMFMFLFSAFGAIRY